MFIPIRLIFENKLAGAGMKSTLEVELASKVAFQNSAWMPKRQFFSKYAQTIDYTNKLIM